MPLERQTCPEKRSLSQRVNRYILGSIQVYIYGMDGHVPGNGYACSQRGKYFSKGGGEEKSLKRLQVP